MLIRLEDLIAWRNERVQNGDCNFDDMLALGVFIEECDKYEECQQHQDSRKNLCERCERVL